MIDVVMLDVDAAFTVPGSPDFVGLVCRDSVSAGGKHAEFSSEGSALPRSSDSGPLQIMWT